MNSEHIKVPGTAKHHKHHGKLTRSLLALTVSGMMANAAIAQSSGDSTQGNIGDTLAPEFQQLDQNGDNKLEWNDVRTVLEPRLSAANMDPRSTFEQYDEDNDNALSEAEFDNLISAIDTAELSSDGTASTDFGSSTDAGVSDAGVGAGTGVGGTAYPSDNIDSTTGEVDSSTAGVASDTGTSPTDGAIVTDSESLDSSSESSVSSVEDPATDADAYEGLSGSQSTPAPSSESEDSLIEQPASYDGADEASDQPSDYEEGTLREEPARFEGSSIDSSEHDHSGYTAGTEPVSEPVGTGTAPADQGSDLAATGSTAGVAAGVNETIGIDDTVNSSAGGEFTTEQPASYDESAVTGTGTTGEQPLEEPINQSPVSQANLAGTPAELRTLPISEIQDKAVRNARGDKIGEVSELVVSRDDGQIGFVVSAGGVMGIGSKKLLAPVEELSVRGEDLVWDTEKSKSELKDSDRYDANNFVVISDQYQTLNDLNQGGLSTR